MFGLTGFEVGIAIAILVPYFIPMIIAGARKHRNYTGIALLNVFLGWTVVGWIGALVWASTGAPHESADTTSREPARRVCPDCGAQVGDGAFCSRCGTRLT